MALPAELAEELRYVEINVGRRIRSMRSGQSRSPLKGSGYEFESHRKYQVGEDFRRIDWNVSARMQEIYIKRHFEEREVSVFLVADLSRSMRFSTTAHSKNLRLMQVGATLGFSAVSDNCNFGFLAFSDVGMDAFEPARRASARWRRDERSITHEAGFVGNELGNALRFLRSQLRNMSHRSFCFRISLRMRPDAIQLAQWPAGSEGPRAEARCEFRLSSPISSNELCPEARSASISRSGGTRREILLSLSSRQRRHSTLSWRKGKDGCVTCLFARNGVPVPLTLPSVHGSFDDAV
jgi:hypothetical protein